jgi:S-adenosylmethionine synthetase
MSVYVSSYGTSKYTEAQLTKIVEKNFNLRPGRIIKDLKLKEPVYQATSSYGHFGRNEFAWEQAKPIQL